MLPFLTRGREQGQISVSVCVYQLNWSWKGGGTACVLCSCASQSCDWYGRPTELGQHFRLWGQVHIGARALLDIKLIWFGYIARLSQDVGHEQMISNGGKFKPAFAEKDKKQTMIDLRGISTNWFKSQLCPSILLSMLRAPQGRGVFYLFRWFLPAFA